MRRGLLQARLRVRPRRAEQRLEPRAEPHDVERVALLERAQAQLQRPPHRLDRVAVHRAGAVHQEHHLARPAGARKIRHEAHRRHDRAVGLALQEPAGLRGRDRGEQQHEVAVHRRGLLRQLDAGLAVREADPDRVRRRLDPGDAARQLDLGREREPVRHRELHRRAHPLAGGRADAAGVLVRDVARGDHRRQREADRVALPRQRLDPRQLDRQLLPGEEVPDARREHVRPLLVEQRRAVPGREGVVVGGERLLALEHAPVDPAAAGLDQQAAQRRAFGQREDVDGLHRHGLGVAVALGHHDPARGARDLGRDAHPLERQRAALRRGVRARARFGDGGLGSHSVSPFSTMSRSARARAASCAAVSADRLPATWSS